MRMIAQRGIIMAVVVCVMIVMPMIAMRIMCGVLDMLALAPARGAEEGEEDQTP
jgi:hypothetical protein